MKRGDECWVPWTRWLDGDWQWYPRRWTWLYTSNERAELSDSEGGGHCDPDDIYATREACEAAIALRAATEAVAKARDEVVKAAKRQHMAWRGDLALPNADYDDRVTATEEAARLLFEAECAEAEARVRLEALR